MIKKIDNHLPKLLEAVSVEGFTVGSWCPGNPDGLGQPAAVCLVIESQKLPTMLLWLKSVTAVNDMIAALQKHRNIVWPNGGG